MCVYFFCLVFRNNYLYLLDQFLSRIGPTHKQVYDIVNYEYIVCRWTEGNALDICFPDCCFDAITVGFGLRNVIDKRKAMQEIFRVLKPGLFLFSIFQRALVILLSFTFTSYVPSRVKGVHSRF